LKHFFEPIEEEKPERQMEFNNIMGGKLQVTDELEKFGLKVGQKLKVKEKSTFDEVNNAKELTMVGFTSDGFIVTQIDGGMATVNYISFQKTHYEPIEEEKPERQMEFEDLGGSKIKVTNETEKSGIKVGQKLKVKAQTSLIKVNNPKKLEVVGFIDNGNIVVQLDEGVVLIYTEDGYKNLFDPI